MRRVKHHLGKRLYLVRLAGLLTAWICTSQVQAQVSLDNTQNPVLDEIALHPVLDSLPPHASEEQRKTKINPSVLGLTYLVTNEKLDFSKKGSASGIGAKYLKGISNHHDFSIEVGGYYTESFDKKEEKDKNLLLQLDATLQSRLLKGLHHLTCR